MWSRYVMSQVKHNGYFVAGMLAGLWLALAVIPLEEEAALVCPAPVAAARTADADDFEPHREERPLGPGGAPPAGRSVQRPRYYSTELGMRGSLLTGVLSSEEALKVQIPALNRTLARLQPALKFFITASTMSTVPGLANVVGFTDTREVLKPFHALKYLADNYLEEYDFFFLITDTAFVHARRLTELVSKLSVSQDVYMGEPVAESEYCSLEAGVLLSNSVLRAVHNELEWCVRNSYSPRHHENLGRCVRHAAHVACTSTVQGETFQSLVVEREDAGDALGASLARAVSARPAGARALAALHAAAARSALTSGASEILKLAGALRRGVQRHPAGYRNHTWPAGLRSDPGLQPPPPENRFSHLRWTLFNASHAFMPDELRTVGKHDAAHLAALDLVMEHARAWCARAWGARDITLVEGARRWDPPTALLYRLLLRLRADDNGAEKYTYKQIEVSRPLGGARLVPVRYVTESARVTLVLAVPPQHASDAAAFLTRYERTAIQQDKNSQLVLVWVDSTNSTVDPALSRAVSALSARHPAASISTLSAHAGEDLAVLGEPARLAGAARAALRVLKAPPDTLLLFVPPHLEFNQDFLNRARMNSIPGVSWFLPVPFSRHSQFSHPDFHASTGTGRFAPLPRAPLLAVYKQDLDQALASWRGPAHSLEEALAASSIRCMRAPEPGAVLQPRPAPCSVRTPPLRAECLRAHQEEEFARIDLGARNLLAQLLLETAAASA